MTKISLKISLNEMVNFICYIFKLVFILLFKLIYLLLFCVCVFVKVDDVRGVLTALTNRNENIQVGHQ